MSISAKRIAIGCRGDGCLEVHYIKASDQLCSNAQVRPNSTWGLERRVREQTVEVACATNRRGQVEVLVTDIEGVLLRTAPEAPREALRRSVKALDLVTRRDGRLAAFCVSQEGTLVRLEEPEHGDIWLPGDELATGATHCAAGVNADGRLEVFYVSEAGRLIHSWEVAPNAGWETPEQLNGQGDEVVQGEQVIVGTNADGRLEVFWTALADGRVWHDWQTSPNGDWAGPEALPVRGSRLAVAQNATGRLELFYIDPKSCIRNLFQVVPNGDWASDGEILGEDASELAVGRNQDGRLELFYFGGDGELWHNWQPAPGRGPWASIVQYEAEADPFR